MRSELLVAKHLTLGLAHNIREPLAGAPASTYFRVREDRVDQSGKVSLRYDSRLHKIGLGRAHKGRSVKLLIAGQTLRVIDLQGELTVIPRSDDTAIAQYP